MSLLAPNVINYVEKMGCEIPYRRVFQWMWVCYLPLGAPQSSEIKCASNSHGAPYAPQHLSSCPTSLIRFEEYSLGPNYNRLITETRKDSNPPDR